MDERTKRRSSSGKPRTDNQIKRSPQRRKTAPPSRTSAASRGKTAKPEARKPAKAPARARRPQDRPAAKPAKAPAAYRKRTYTVKVRHTGVAVKLLTMAAVVAAVLFGFILFFRVGKIPDPSAAEGQKKWLPKVQVLYLDADREEQSITYYTPAEVVAASGIEIGANLLTVRKDAVAARIMTELPYVSEVQVRRDLPDGVTIYIAEFEVTYSIRDSSGNWWLINRAGRVLNSADAAEAAEHINILGLTIEPPKLGDEMKPANTVFVPAATPTTAPAATDENAPEDGETEPPASETKESTEAQLVVETLPADQLSELQTKKTSLLQILALLEQTDYFKQIVSIDLTYSYDIELWYGEQYLIRIGNTEQLEYKLSYLSEVLKQLKSYQSGTIDLTFTEEKNARFQPFR